jgi:hypothetical protein
MSHREQLAELISASEEISDWIAHGLASDDFTVDDEVRTALKRFIEALSPISAGVMAVRMEMMGFPKRTG